jgi:hypothetical protein
MISEQLSLPKIRLSHKYVSTIVHPLAHLFRYLQPNFNLAHLSLQGFGLREDDAEAKREEWKAKRSPPCEHGTLKLLYTVENYITGDCVCIECGELVGRVSKP